eukprot:COSAG04_NODE_20117_length_400_cov_0.996678_1_plen_50_part_10
MLPLLIMLALCGGNQLVACGTAEPFEPHCSMPPAANGTITPAQRNLSPAT